MNGVTRRLLEGKAPERDFEPLRRELIFFVGEYLKACSQTASV